MKKAYIISSPITTRCVNKGDIGTFDELLGNIRIGSTWFPFDDRWEVKTPIELWKELGDVPIDENEEIEISFLDFEIGTDKFNIWHWFEETFDLSVAKDLMRV